VAAAPVAWSGQAAAQWLAVAVAPVAEPARGAARLWPARSRRGAARAMAAALWRQRSWPAATRALRSVVPRRATARAASGPSPSARPVAPRARQVGARLWPRLSARRSPRV